MSPLLSASGNKNASGGRELEKGPFPGTLGLYLCGSNAQRHLPPQVAHLLTQCLFQAPGLQRAQQVKVPLSRAGTTADSPTWPTQAGYLATHHPGTCFSTCPGARRPSRGWLFPARHARTPSVGGGRRGFGKCRVVGCPHPSPRSTKDARWQTFLATHHGRAGTPARAAPWSGRGFPDISSSLAAFGAANVQDEICLH